MLSCLFIAVLWSPAGKGLTSRLLFVMFNCVFVTFPCGTLRQVWYLIVPIPDLCRLSYFVGYEQRERERERERERGDILNICDTHIKLSKYKYS